MKFLYRDCLAMLIAFFLSIAFYPELDIYNIKYYGIVALIVTLWYLGATREKPNPWKNKESRKDGKEWKW